MNLRNKMMLLSFLFLYGTVSAEVILIPSDYEDYTYSETQSYLNSDIHQMKDETYSDAVHRDIYLESDMALDGYFIEEDE